MSTPARNDRAWLALGSIFAIALLVRVLHIAALRGSPFFAFALGDAGDAMEHACRADALKVLLRP